MKLKYLFILLLFVSASIPFIDNKQNLSKKPIDLEGIPYSSQFLINNSFGHIVFSITQDDIGKMYFATRKGIYIFDGITWKFIPTSGVPLKLFRDTLTKNIFVICNNSISLISPIKADSIIEIVKNIRIFPSNIQILTTDTDLYIYTNGFICRIDRNDVFDYSLINSQNLNLGGIIKLNGQIYVFKKNSGFYKLSKQNIEHLNVFPLSQNFDILFSLPFGKKTIFATNNDSLYIYDGKTLKSFFKEKRNYIKNSFIYNGVNLSEKYMIILTLTNGAIIIDKNSSKPILLLNINNGLPDNEIYNVFLDKDNGLWIAHKFGLTRFDLSLPLINYNYIGLQGRVLSTLYYNSVLYVMTSNGLYYLTKTYSQREIKTVTTEVQKIIQNQNNVAVRTSSSIETSQQPDVNLQPQNIQEQRKQKRSFFSKIVSWFKRKKKKNKQQPETLSVSVQKTDTVKTDSLNNQVVIKHRIIKRKRIKIKKQKSVFPFFYYKKISDIKGTPRKLFRFNSSIFLATINGIYKIDNFSAKLVYKGFISQIFITNNKQGIYFQDNEGLKFLNLTDKNIKPHLIISAKTLNDEIISLVETDTSLWLGTQGFVYKISLKNRNKIAYYSISPVFLDPVKIIYLRHSHRLLFLTSEGVYRYMPKLDTFATVKKFDKHGIPNMNFISSQYNIAWYKEYGRWYYLGAISVDSIRIKYLNLFENITNLRVDEANNLWVVDKYNRIYKLKPQNIIQQKEPNIFVEKITIGDSLIFYSDTVRITYKQRGKIKIFLTSPFLIKNNGILFQYQIKHSVNEPDQWSEWFSKPYIELTGLSDGKYLVYIRAKNVFDLLSHPYIITIVIRPPFYKNIWFQALFVLFLIFLIAFFAYLRTKRLERENRILEEKVRERTAQIRKQNEILKAKNEEISRQNEIVRKQNEEIKRQRDEIKKQHEYITQSINYARRIQTAMLPTDDILKTYFSEYFIISMPKDIVSGDFYWFKLFNNKLLVAVADCTGHGVPGAFLSMLGIAFLNEILNYKPEVSAADLLNTLRENIIIALQEKEDNQIRDGMDIALAIFDFENNKVNFAGAYNPLFIFRDNNLIILQADKMPVGYSRKNNVPFSNKWIEIQKGDTFYLFSDGYYDQLGGKHFRKFNYGNFKKLLSMIQDLPLKDQKDLLITTFYEWKGSFSQIDDITIVGLKV